MTGIKRPKTFKGTVMSDRMERTRIVGVERFLKVPKYRRAKKTVKAVKEFLIKHMKAEDVKIHKELNDELLKHGRQNPPSKVKVKAVKYGNIVRVNLEGFSIEEPKKKEEKEAKKEEKKEEIKEELTKVEEQKQKEEEEKIKVVHKKQ